MFTILGADGKEYGPVATDKISAWIAGGRANLQTKARRDGETGWKTLGDFPEFAGATVPPPVPGPTLAAGSAADSLQPAGPVLAGRGTRLLAQIIDALISFLVILPGCTLLMISGAMHNWRNQPLALAGLGLTGLCVLTLFIVQCYLLATRGQTLGKKLMDVRIVRHEDSTNPGFVKAVLLRLFVNGVIGAVPVLGPAYTLVDICFIFRDDRRCIHDLIAGTQVVAA